MSANLRLSGIAVSVALLTMSGGAVNITGLHDFDGAWILGAVAAESGGHDSGSTSGHTGSAGGGPPAGKGGGHDTGSTGGHDTGSTGGHTTGGGCGGGSGGCGGGHDTGSTGGHDSGGGGKGKMWGKENPMHGLKKKHEGHAAGMHGDHGSTAHDVGARRFAGGAGVTSTNLVPEGLGRYGEGAPSNQGRTRYWGGWTLPEDVDPGTYSIASTELVPLGGGGGASVNVRGTLQSAARCDDVGGTMTTAQRFSEPNLQRISAARALLDPATASAPAGEKPYLLASLQEELQKPAPDLALAGVYVGLIAKGPVTADKVKSVGARLCVRVGDQQASQIAQAAEQQRVAIK